MTTCRPFRCTNVFASLDGLRCISIIAVVWHHAGANADSLYALQFGFLGVELFFVISGFLIVTLLLRERDKTGSISLRKFYTRRVLRIFPLYYAIILGVAAFYGLIKTDSGFGVRFIADLPYYLTYTANFVPVGLAIVWSLATEEQFYLFWPAVEKTLRKHVILILAALIFANQLLNFPEGRSAIAAALGSAEWTGLSVYHVTFTPILLGVAAAHMLHSERGFRLLRFVAANRLAPALWLLAIVLLISLGPSDISGLPRLVIHACMTCLVISCVWREDHVLRGLLTLAPIRRIGKISYGMYLIHIFAIAVARFMLQDTESERSVAVFVAALTITAVAADLSFRFFETPFLELKRRYSIVHQAHV